MLVEQSNITKEWELYMYLLRCAIRGENPNTEAFAKYKEIESEKICEKARRSGQLFLLEENIREFATYRKEENLPEKSDFRKIVCEYEKYKCIRNVLTLAKKHEIPFVIFKAVYLPIYIPNIFREILVIPIYLFIRSSDSRQLICL